MIPLLDGIPPCSPVSTWITLVLFGGFGGFEWWRQSHDHGALLRATIPLVRIQCVEMMFATMLPLLHRDMLSTKRNHQANSHDNRSIATAVKSG